MVIVSTVLLIGSFPSKIFADEENERTPYMVEEECIDNDTFETEAIRIRIPSVREMTNSVSGGLKNVRDGVAQALNDAGINTDFSINNNDRCAMSVATTVGGSMACGGCIAASTETAGATAVACSNTCGTASGALVVALHSCKI